MDIKSHHVMECWLKLWILAMSMSARKQYGIPHLYYVLLYVYKNILDTYHYQLFIIRIFWLLIWLSSIINNWNGHDRERLVSGYQPPLAVVIESFAGCQRFFMAFTFLIKFNEAYEAINAEILIRRPMWTSPIRILIIEKGMRRHFPIWWKRSDFLSYLVAELYIGI